ncbi:alpha/beta hydrolase [Bowmanella sp. Y26]|uniref:alpha/beta hydrolase n=1 Tax=Bowmanella yangjiangensis TaxID=2811230 RepID=UPI001BDC02DE|nr:alpha/beta hydrolase-fold protein [Bowmanella yangjiangensis]MBT1064149.1 alpha/beta hydrolase [Bowmanella yangjiangensis]
MKTTYLRVLSCLLLILVGATAYAKPLVLPQIQVIPIKASATERQYELLIKLPGNYAENSDKAYPVIYFTDALWHVELLSASTFFQMEDSILVGLSWQKDIDAKLIEAEGAYVSRFRDYSFAPSSNPENQAKYQFGQAAKYLDFIRHDVIPFVESHYRTEPANRSYFGYSMGGLFGAYILLSQPDTFKNYMLGSPSVWRMAQIEALPNNAKPFNANVFVTYGSEEQKLSPHVDSLIQFLHNKKDASLSLTHKIPDGSHQTASPMTAVMAINWLATLQQQGE